MTTWGKVGGESALPGRGVRRDARREREQPRPVSQALQVDIGRAVPLIHAAMCVMSAAHEHKRGGMLVARVMQCADEPPSVLVSLPKGHRLATLIRDSHAFALTAIEPTQRLIVKKFGSDEPGDPFDMVETRTLATGAPVLTRSIAAVDCEVMRHFDLEADHEVYVGQVLAAMVFARDHAAPAVNGAVTSVPGAAAEISTNGSRRDQHDIAIPGRDAGRAGTRVNGTEHGRLAS